MTSTNATARRATIYRADDGWRYKVQGWNWRTIDASTDGVSRRSSAVRTLERRWPGVEIVEPADV